MRGNFRYRAEQFHLRLFMPLALVRLMVRAFNEHFNVLICLPRRKSSCAEVINKGSEFWILILIGDAEIAKHDLQILFFCKFFAHTFGSGGGGSGSQYSKSVTAFGSSSSSSQIL